MARNKKFTIFDVMEEKGVFAHNPANAGATDPITKEVIYKGPVEYPKMFYHPQGEVRVSHPGEDVMTPFGPKHCNEHVELVNAIAKNAEEEAALRADGWHDAPWKAMKAAGIDVRKIESAQQSAPMTETQKDLYIKALEKKLSAAGIAPDASMSINGQTIEAPAALLAATRPTEELLAEQASLAAKKRDLQSAGLVEED